MILHIECKFDDQNGDSTLVNHKWIRVLMVEKKGLGHLCPEKWFTSLNSWGDHFQQIRLFR